MRATQFEASTAAATEVGRTSLRGAGGLGMKKLLLFLLLGSLYLPTQAQYFGLESSVWKYRKDYLLGPDSDYLISYDHDTVLDGYDAIALKVEWSSFSSVGGNYYETQHEDPYGIVRYSNDSVFYWSNQQFFLLYDFGAQIGDSWVAGIDPLIGYPQECSDTLIVEVSDTGSIDINGVSRRYITLYTSSSSAVGIEGLCVEGIGLMEWIVYSQEWDEITEGNGFLPGFRNCGSQLKWNNGTKSLCYYTDSVVGYYFTDFLTLNCGPVAVELEPLQIVNVYPNPASGKFVLDLPFGQSDETVIEILDRQGRVVLSRSQLAANSSQLTIDLTAQPSGLYLVRLLTEKEVFTVKIIKE